MRAPEGSGDGVAERAVVCYPGAMDRLELAGAAAEILETLGFVSCARKKDGVVSVDLWKVVGGRQRFLRRPVGDEERDARALAEACAAEFRAALTTEPH